MVYQVPRDAMADTPAKPVRKPDPRFSGYAGHVETQKHRGNAKRPFLQGGPFRLPIKLKSGETVNAASLRLFALWPELQRLGVEGIQSHMGKDALLTAYEAHLAAEAEKKAPKPGQPMVTPWLKPER